MTRRSSMKWLWRCGGFLGLVLLAHCAARWLDLEYWQPFINNQALKIHVYQKDGLVPDVLFLGTSKTNRAVIPAVLERELDRGPVSVFCLGQRGMSAQAQGIVLRDVLRTNGNPRLVVFGITPSTLNANHGGFCDVLRYYASPADLARAAPGLRSAEEWGAAGRGVFRGMTSLYLHTGCRLFQGGLKMQLASIRRLKGFRYGPASREGVPGLAGMTEEGQRDLLLRMRIQGRRLFMASYEIGGAAQAGLEEIIRLTRSRGIGLALFNPPVTPEYRHALYRPEEYAEFVEYVERITRREGIPFLDLDDGRLGLTEADYFDFGHLNAAGAGKASRRLARELIAPALKSAVVPER